ncbi:MAG: stress-induced morphogen [Myxococcota bacterium]|jgi:stress-induced morphogen
MIKADDLTQRIQTHFPDAVVQLKDLTGTEDHWEAEIVSEAFAGLPLIKRHRLVYTALKTELQGPIHAFTMTTLTPAEVA